MWEEPGKNQDIVLFDTFFFSDIYFSENFIYKFGCWNKYFETLNKSQSPVSPSLLKNTSGKPDSTNTRDVPDAKGATDSPDLPNYFEC